MRPPAGGGIAASSLLYQRHVRMALRLSTLGSDPEHPDDNKAELTEHLAELRTRLIRACLYCGVGMIVMYTRINPISRLLAAPITGAIPQTSRPHLPAGVHGTSVVTNFAEPFLL